MAYPNHPQYDGATTHKLEVSAIARVTQSVQRSPRNIINNNRRAERQPALARNGNGARSMPRHVYRFALNFVVVPANTALLKLCGTDTTRSSIYAYTT